MRHSSFDLVDIQDNIVFIRDRDQGGPSITNDAEQVFRLCQERYGWPKESVRVVYCDTQGEWAEIVPHPHRRGEWWSGIEFRPWHGLAWDRLKRK
jgi:hypothetical protein